MILSINTTLIHLALQGTVLCDTPRAGVVPLIYFRTILFVPEIGRIRFQKNSSEKLKNRFVKSFFL